MLNESNKPTAQFSNTMLDINKMQDELTEHRYHLEQKVEQETEQLLKRIALLESCNATLCDKLAVAQKEIISLKQQAAQTSPKKNTEQKGCAVQLYGMNDQIRKLIGLGAQDNSFGRAATA